MKKSELIKKLQEIEEDVDILSLDSDGEYIVCTEIDFKENTYYSYEEGKYYTGLSIGLL